MSAHYSVLADIRNGRCKDNKKIAYDLLLTA